MRALKILLFLNLFIRLVLVVYVSFQGNWMGSDSAYYLSNARNVCIGDWGGDGFKPALYPGLVCAFWPGNALTQNLSGVFGAAENHIVSSEIALGAFVPLLLQTLLVWAVGYYFYSRSKKLKAKCAGWISVFWLYDPALFFYSVLFMADAFCAVLVFLLAIAFREKHHAKVGLLLGLIVLTRNIGTVLLLWTVLMMIVQYCMDPLRKARRSFIALGKQLGVVVGLAAIVVVPQVVYNGLHQNTWATNLQSKTWVQAIAGIVEYDGHGLNAMDAEGKWFEEKHAASEAWGVLIRKWPVTVKYFSKGWARVLFGHVNTEATYVLTGQSPIGPGWFKSADQWVGPRVSGKWIVLWVFGLFCSAVFSLILYVFVFKNMRRFHLRNGFVLWVLGAVGAFVLTPALYGDARFRLPALPLLLLLWLYLETKSEGRTTRAKL